MNKQKGLTLIELLVVALIFGMVSVAIAKFFKSFIAIWRESEATLQIHQAQNMVIDNILTVFKNMTPVKCDNLIDTMAYFGSIGNKYIDFVSNENKNLISDLSSNPTVTYSNSSFIRFISLTPTVSDSEQATLYNFSFGVGNDKYLSENTSLDNSIERSALRLFRSAISSKLDQRLTASDSLNSDTPYYLMDYVNNVTAINMRFFDSYKNQWFGDVWSETYLPAAVEITVYAADDMGHFGDAKRVGRGKKASVIVSIPCEHIE